MADTSTSGLNSKIDNVLNRLGDAIDGIINEFGSNPLRTTIKVIAIVYFIKWVRRNLR